MLVPQDVHASRYQGEGSGVPQRNATSTMRMKAEGGADDDPDLVGLDARHGLTYATLDGGFGVVLPVPERAFHRLQRLQRQMASRAVGHNAGCV